MMSAHDDLLFAYPSFYISSDLFQAGPASILCASTPAADLDFVVVWLCFDGPVPVGVLVLPSALCANMLLFFDAFVHGRPCFYVPFGRGGDLVCVVEWPFLP